MRQQGIWAKKVTIDGVALTINSIASCIYAEANYGIAVEDGDETINVINGAELNLVSNQSAPISAKQGILIDGSTVTATTNASSHHALYAYEGGIEINNSTVKAYAESSSNAAVWADTSIKITGESDVTATGGYGIYAGGDVSITGSKVTATGADGNTSSIGIYSDMGNVTIEGGEVTATGGEATGSDAYSHGIDAYGNVSITGGTVTATDGAVTGSDADSIGIYSYSENVFISGGMVEATGGSEAIYAWRNVIVSPQTGKAIEVKAGENADDAAEISGSPFTLKPALR